MVAIPKIIGVMCCGVVLCLGLSGKTVAAGVNMKAGQSGERIGGQAGRGYEPVKYEQITAAHPGERIGGQAGLGYEPVEQRHVAAPHPGARIGGQAGLGYEQVIREHHAGVNEKEEMGK